MRESALPTDYNLATLGVDYADPVSWATARVKYADLVGNAKGEVLYVPPGTHSFAGYIQLDHNHKPATSDDDYFPIIISDADSKAVFDITANDIPIGLGILTNNPTRVSDIIFDFESDMDEAYYQVLSGNSGTYLNCIIRNVSTPNAAADAYLILFAGGNVFVNCAIDIGGSIESGLAPIIGLSDFTGGTAYAYNCTIADARLTYGVYGIGAVIAKNVIAQDASLASIVGNVIQTTCAVDQGLSLDTDGYTLLESDAGNGTDLSSDATFAFSDDINGDTRILGQWERGADAFTIAAADGAGNGLEYTIASMDSRVSAALGGTGAKLGSELWDDDLVDPSLGTGWSKVGVNTYSCDGSQATWSVLDTIINIVESGKLYKQTITLSGVSAGYVQPKVGNVNPGNTSSNGTHTFYIVAEDDFLSMTANADFVGTVEINEIKEVQASSSWLLAFTPQFDSDQIDATYQKLISTGNLAIQFNNSNIAITDGTNTATVAHGGFSAGDTVTGVFTADASGSKLQVGLVGASSITWGTATSYTGGFAPGTDILVAEDNEEYFALNYWSVFDGVPGGDGEVLAAVMNIKRRKAGMARMKMGMKL